MLPCCAKKQQQDTGSQQKRTKNHNPKVFTKPKIDKLTSTELQANSWEMVGAGDKMRSQ